MFVFIKIEFHIVYFDHIVSPIPISPRYSSPAYPYNFILFVSLKKHRKLKQAEKNTSKVKKKKMLKVHRHTHKRPKQWSPNCSWAWGLA